jgi:hypothetical protein
MDGQMNGWLGWMGDGVFKWKFDGWMNGWMDRWIDGWMRDRWMDRWTNREMAGSLDVWLEMDGNVEGLIGV